MKKALTWVREWWPVFTFPGAALVLIAVMAVGVPACIDPPDVGPPGHDVIPPLGAAQASDICTGPNQHLDPANPCHIIVTGIGESWTWTAKTDIGAEFLGCVQTTNSFVAWTCGVKWPAAPGHDYEITQNASAARTYHAVDLSVSHPEHHEPLFGAAQDVTCAPGSDIGALTNWLVPDTDLGRNYIACLNATPAPNGWTCWFKHAAVVDRDYHYSDSCP